MAAGVVHVPFYATGFRGDQIEAALAELAPISTRYGATHYEVSRSRDDPYRFLMTCDFEHKADWEAFYFGPEFTEMRAACTSWYQVPLLYVWHDLVIRGELREPAQASPAPG